MNVREILVPYLQLCRAANVFTAFADIALGYFLTHPAEQAWGTLALLMITSGCLYTAGMVLNDVFDLEIDRVERPKRPLPAEKVTLTAAIRLATGLVFVGALTSSLAGASSLFVAGLLVVCIVAYDGFFKSSWAGPVFMGGCRFLNVMLGASAPISLIESTVPFGADLVWALPQLHVAAGLGIYIAGVTWFARKEVGGSTPVQLASAAGIINLGIAVLVAFLLNAPDHHARWVPALVMLAAIAVSFNRRIIAAIRDPIPLKVQRSVKTMLLSLVTLDAALVLFAQSSIWYAVGVAVLLVPAVFLARFLAVT